MQSCASNRSTFTARNNLYVRCTCIAIDLVHFLKYFSIKTVLSTSLWSWRARPATHSCWFVITHAQEFKKKTIVHMRTHMSYYVYETCILHALRGFFFALTRTLRTLVRYYNIIVTNIMIPTHVILYIGVLCPHAT
jgi:hypothetical protein